MLVAAARHGGGDPRQHRVARLQGPMRAMARRSVISPIPGRAPIGQPPPRAYRELPEATVGRQHRTAQCFHA